MTLSGWTRLWIVAGALGLVGCGNPNPSVARLCAELPDATYRDLRLDVPTLKPRAEMTDEELEAARAQAIFDAGNRAFVAKAREFCAGFDRANSN